MAAGRDGAEFGEGGEESTGLANKLICKYFPWLCPTLPGGTPLHLAAMCGCERAVHELLKNGADPLARDEYRRTPLECAKLMASSSQPQQDTSEAERADIIAQLSNAQDAYEEGLQEDFLRNLNPGRRPATARAAASAASRSPHTPATRLSPARPASSAPQVTQKSPNLIEQFAKQLKESPSVSLCWTGRANVSPMQVVLPLTVASL